MYGFAMRITKDTKSEVMFHMLQRRKFYICSTGKLDAYTIIAVLFEATIQMKMFIITYINTDTHTQNLAPFH